MSSIDERVVQMQFDNKQFETGVKTTLSSLDALNKGLKLEGATKGLSDVSSAASKLSLGNIASGVDTIASKFKTLGVVGVAALANITTQVLQTGERMVKSLTLDHLADGLQVYETKINAIQTILANTTAEGTKLPQVTAALQELNKYANLTVFSFADMAKNIGTFTAAGVDLKTSVASIKGIANLAALSGSNADQASTAMYQLSQAIAAGTVKLQDWNSVVNAGLGGKVFQKALTDTARATGTNIDAIIKKAGSFRASLQEGWLTSDILTKTLAQFTGDLSDAQLKAMGFTEKEAQGILAMGKAAVKSATDIRTVTQLQAALKEEVATAWANVWETLIGNITDATTLLSKVHTTLENAFTGPVIALNELLKAWAKLGGRTALINSITNAFAALNAIVKPIKEAFREIFPAITGKQLADLTKSLEKFTAGLKIGADTANELKRTFAGVFAVFGIGLDIIKGVIGVLADLFGLATKGSGGFLRTTASVGDFLVALKKSIEAGDGLKKFFAGLEAVLAAPIKGIQALTRFLKDFFSGIDIDASPVLDRLQKRFAPLGALGNVIVAAWSHVLGAMKNFSADFDKVSKKISDFFGKFNDLIEGTLGAPLNFSGILDSINTGLFGAALLLLRKFLKNGIQIDAGGGFFGAVKEAVEGLTGTLKAMQTQLKANALLKIAAAIGLLAISLGVLSLIDSDRLTSAGVAITGLFTELLGAMAIFTKISGAAGFVKMPILTASMIGLAIAIDLLVIAVAALSKLNWNQLAKGLTGLGVILGELVVTMQLMPPGEKMISTGAGLLVLAGAINLLVVAVTNLSGLSWNEMAKGLTGVAALLVSLALFTKFSEFGGGGVLQGAGIVLLAAGIRILVSAVQDFSQMSWGAIAKGLVSLAGALAIMSGVLTSIPPTAPLAAAGILGVALSLSMVADALAQMGTMSWGEILKGLTTMLGALTIISAALTIIPPDAPLGAAAILIVAIALGKIGDALNDFASMSWGEIGKAAAVLAGSLFIIADAMLGMDEALPGAAALLIVVASLKLLAPVLEAFGKMSLGEIGKAMLTLAGVFTILGLAGLVLTPLVPTLLGLGVAVTLLGIGMLAAGAGVLLFATGLTALSVAGAGAAVAIVAIVRGLLGLLPEVAKELGLAVIAFAEVIAKAGPAIVDAITVVLESLIKAIVKLTPEIINALTDLILFLLNKLADNVPKMVDAGFRLLNGILTGIANNIGKVVKSATNVIVNFLNAISANLGKVIDAGIKLIISFVNGLAQGIRNNTDAMRSAGVNLAGAIIDGMTFGLASGVGKVANEAKNVAKSALNSAKSFLGINSPSKEFIKIGMGVNEGFAKGLDKYSNLTADSAAAVGKTALDTVSQSLTNLSKLVEGPMEINPTITPVLDLTDVKKNAAQIGNLLASKSIVVGTTFGKATDVSNTFDHNRPVSDDVSSTQTGGDVIFNQTNNSPKALSTADIYRQTKNQISKVKEVTSAKQG